MIFDFQSFIRTALTAPMSVLTDKDSSSVRDTSGIIQA